MSPKSDDFRLDVRFLIQFKVSKSMTLLHHSLLVQRDSKGDKTGNFANEKSILDSWVLQQIREVSIIFE